MTTDKNMAHDEKHKDGSGAVAIKMIHTDSKWTIASDVFRLIFSIGLLLFSISGVFYAVATRSTTVPDIVPVWATYLALSISLFILGVMEGLQISVVELAHKDPTKYEKLHPRAAKLLAFENQGRNVERFLMGRQVLVVFTVFVAARITTFDGFWADVPQTLVHSLMFSGFLGVILVVVVAQLTPQVLAAAYPVEFLNLPGMKIAFWACLLVESTGLVHAVWFLCVTVRKLVYNCMCKHRVVDDEAFDIAARERVGSKSKASISVISIKRDGRTEMVGSNIPVTTDIAKAAEQAEIDIEEETSIQMNEKNNRMKAEQNRFNNSYKAEYIADNDDIHDRMHTLIQHVGDQRDLFYIYGKGKYMSPAQCYDKFENAGLTPPAFLSPPDNINHIPPHIVAMTLLKMYTEKCAEDAQVVKNI